MISGSGSGKNQFTRQKNVEINNINVDSEVVHDASITISTDYHKCLLTNGTGNTAEETNNTSTTKCNHNFIDYEDNLKNAIETLSLTTPLHHDRHNESPPQLAASSSSSSSTFADTRSNLFKFPSNQNLTSGVRIENSPSSSSSSSSPSASSTLPNSTSPYLHIDTALGPSKLSLSACSVQSSSSASSLSNLHTASSSSNSNSNLNSNNNTASSQLTALLNKHALNGNKMHISPNLKQKLTKAATGPSQMSHLSRPIANASKTRRLGNLMGFSVGSFFSKSVTADEEEEKTDPSQSIDAKQTSTMTTTRDTSRPRKFGKSILALSVFAGYNSNSKAKKCSDSSSSNSSSVISSKNPLNESSPVENGSGGGVLSASTSPIRSVPLLQTKSNSQSRSTDAKKKIGTYDVDLEKLAKELILPTLNAPLTSFRKEEATNKPPLLSSKTIDTPGSLASTDSSSNLKASSKTMIQRSLTNNK